MRLGQLGRLECMQYDEAVLASLMGGLTLPNRPVLTGKVERILKLVQI